MFLVTIGGVPEFTANIFHLLKLYPAIQIYIILMVRPETIEITCISVAKR